jgi:hypothetical protein
MTDFQFSLITVGLAVAVLLLIEFLSWMLDALFI